MPTYDDGTTPTLVTEKSPAIAYKVRCGSETYIKPDGSIGTAGCRSPSQRHKTRRSFSQPPSKAMAGGVLAVKTAAACKMVARCTR